jgi:hypothetical protein
MTFERLHRLRRFSPWLAGFTLCGLLPTPLPPAKAQRTVATKVRSAAPDARLSAPDERYDPRALLLLKKMGEAYSRLEAMDLHIDMSSALIPLETPSASNGQSIVLLNPTPFHVDETTLRRQGQIHMAFRQANQLLIETEQVNPQTNKRFDVRWVSDGRDFWSYSGDKKIYTREKAPGNIHDFSRLQYLDGGTLELMLLIGPNPFADLAQSVDGVHRIGEAEVRGVATEVVSILMEDPIEQSELRFYIGKEDSLLYRMEVESVPVLRHEGPIKVGSKLDALLEANERKPPPEQLPPDQVPEGAPAGATAAPAAPSKPVGSFTRFDNDLTLNSTFPPGTFAFKPPKDGLMLGGQPVTVKRLTPRQRLVQMAKEIRQKRAQMLRGSQ